MDYTPVNVIRESTRNLLKLNRRTQRDVEKDERRLVVDQSVTTDQIADIGIRLKNKSLVTIPELHILKNVLIDEPKNLDIILGIHGALRGLVRELSGLDVRRQNAAAGCCCNLALGDSRSCTAVAKASGPYLLAALDSLSCELAVTCAWTLGNLAGSGPKVCEILIAQGALAKLIELLNSHEDLRDAAMYALVHFTYQLRDSLSVDHLVKIIEALTKLETSTSAQLLFILSCHEHFENGGLPEPFLEKLLKATIVSTRKHVACLEHEAETSSDFETVYLYRTLANISKKEDSAIIVNYFMVENISDCFNKILQSDDRVICESLLWLLGVLYRHNSCNNFFIEQMAM